MARSLLPAPPKLPKLPRLLPKIAALPRPVGLSSVMGSLGGMFGSVRKGLK